MNLNSLTLLVEIIDAGNLSLAARKLKMSRANVSYHLKQLEQSTGVQLVRRTTRKIEATEVGMRLYQHGRRILDELQAAQETLFELGQGFQGRVRLSVPSGFGESITADWLIEFKRLYPDIVLEITFENRIEDLLGDEIDIAIRVMSEPPQSLVARELGPVTFFVCAARSYVEQHGMPKRLEQLRSVPVITSGVVGRQLRLAAYQGEKRYEVMLEPTLFSEHFPFLRRAILAGLGVGIVPDYIIKEDIKTGEVITAFDNLRLSIFGTTMFMLYTPNRYQTRASRTLIDFILERARAVLATPSPNK
ncbi:LysR family transcriptional regulator [Rouxiella sp. Mn2063]|uniref:LysR family transcriptional regulator n=1 Tax=Rouxiella sp. Mn2063 TaxID=3395262 RepID=UPI003BC2E3F9